MDLQLRETGIDVLGGRPWGTHLCGFYESRDDLVDFLVPYFTAGLENNESCICIASQPLDEREAYEVMREGGLRPYLDEGQLEIASYEGWYLKEGVFDGRSVIGEWSRRCREALGRGYDGVRVAGNMAWLERVDWRSLVEYEAQVNRLVTGSPMIVVCNYPLHPCDERRMADLAATHQAALFRDLEGWATAQIPDEISKLLKIRDESELLDKLLFEGRLERAAASMLRELEDSIEAASVWRTFAAFRQASCKLCDKIQAQVHEAMELLVGGGADIQSLARNLARLHRRMSGARCVRARTDPTGMVMEIEGCRGFGACDARTGMAGISRCLPAMVVSAILQQAAETPVRMELGGKDRVCTIRLRPAWELESLRDLEDFDVDGLIVLRRGRLLFSHLPSEAEARALNEAVLLDDERPPGIDTLRIEEFGCHGKTVITARLGETLLSLCTSSAAVTEELRGHIAGAIRHLANEF